MNESCSKTAALAQPAVHSVDEVVLTVPDLDQARHFYRSFGLDVRDEEGGLALYAWGHPHRWVRLLPGLSKQLQWVRLGIYEEDREPLRQRMEALGVTFIDPPAAADRFEGDLWIAGADGLPTCLRVAPKCSPCAPAPRLLEPACANAGRAPARRAVAPVRPLYLSHVLFFSVDVPAAIAFYERVLGLRLSDRSGEVIAFLHTPHGSDHHLIALAKAPRRGLHHTSWCVPSIDAVGHGMEQMAAAGYSQRWGVGRHVLGSNYFCYIRDPWGSYAEYSYDIDFVEAGATWPAADHPAEDSIYVWGPAIPADFVVNFE